ncbi:hypothetical protein BJF78_22760 [Pseudonocardia sp. CNS-139]|nr:hypothetical protein BJF78_22760 [Pseudonocardia sp. CNS-139]
MTLSSVVANAQPAGCRTFTHRYFLGSGTAITLRIGFVDTAIRVCNERPWTVASAEVWQTVGTTGPGAAAGFVVEPGLAVVTEQYRFGARARYEGRVRVCLAQRTPICSPAQDYTVFAVYNLMGPALHNRLEPVWRHAESRGVAYYETA